VARVAIVLVGGDPALAHHKHFLPDDADVIAADSGVHAAEVLGLPVDCIVGDFDSADPAIVDAHAQRGATIERHPADKDATDLELALDAAQRRGAERVVVVGGAGGRLDHLLANLLLLGAPKYAGMQIEALVGDARLAVVRGGEAPTLLDSTPGELLTLVPLGGDARGITTTGLQYPLANEDLHAGTTRGVSNVVQSRVVSLCVERGTLLVVRPTGGAA
jgi:thiamine pyrophosphokinase